MAQTLTSDDLTAIVNSIKASSLGTELHLVKAVLANKTQFTVSTGVLVVKDDDGTTTLATFTPTEASGVVTVTRT
jgi:hypothetical protein